MSRAARRIHVATLTAALAVSTVPSSACHSDSVSQLMVNERSHLVRDPFPALSSDGREVALLTAPNPMDQAINLEVRSTVGDELVQRYVLRSESGGRDQPDLASTTIEPNKYLRAGGFTAMESLFTSAHLRNRPVPTPRTYEQSSRGLKITIDHESKVVTVSEAETGRVLLNKEPARETVLGYEDVCAAGSFAAVPYAGWIDRARHVVTIQYAFAFNDSCDLPEIWHVVRLDEAK